MSNDKKIAYRHSLFPTLVTETFYDQNEEFVSIFLDNCYKYLKNGWSDESNGSLDLHLDKNFESLFIFLNECVVNYLKELGIDYHLFDINFTKSWLNLLTTEPIRRHDHRNYHLSVSYYVQVPEHAKHVFRFTDINNDRYPFFGIDINANKKTEFVPKFYDLNPVQGTTIVFPANLYHQAVSVVESFVNLDVPIIEKKDLNNRRICLASDIILTYKAKQNQPYGIQPVSNWKTFKGIK